MITRQTLRRRQEEMRGPVSEDRELDAVLAILEALERGLDALPDVSGIQPTLRPTASGWPRPEGDRS